MTTDRCNEAQLHRAICTQAGHSVKLMLLLWTAVRLTGLCAGRGH